MRSDPQLNLRLPQALKARIEEAATKNRRSVTAEIINRLETSFEVDQGSETIDMRGLSDEKLAAAFAMGLRLAQRQTDRTKRKKDP